MAVSFKRTETDDHIVEAIVTRYLNLLTSLNDDDIEMPTRLGLTMDLIATHANGCPLDFPGLLHFPDFDFVHDVSGIHGRIDRSTGKLTNYFVPRCAKWEASGGEASEAAPVEAAPSEEVPQ